MPARAAPLDVLDTAGDQEPGGGDVGGEHGQFPQHAAISRGPGGQPGDQVAESAAQVIHVAAHDQPLMDERPQDHRPGVVDLAQQRVGLQLDVVEEDRAGWMAAERHLPVHRDAR